MNPRSPKQRRCRGCHAAYMRRYRERMKARTMSDAEARIVAAVIATTDDGCRVCVTRATCALDRDLPWVPWFDLVAEAGGEWTADELRAGAPCHADAV